MQKVTDVHAICLPIGLGQIPGQTCCPLGIMQKGWAESLIEANGLTIERFAQEFFSLWDHGLTPATWQNLLRAQLLQNAEWNSFDTEYARLMRKQIAHCVERRKILDTPLQPDLVEAYEEHQHLQNSDDAPKSTGIGYRKRLISEQVNESWSMKRPAYLQFSDNKGSASWQHPALWLGI